MFATTGILLLTGYDILPIFFDDVPMRMTDEPWDARWYAWEDRNDFPGSYKRSGEGFRTATNWFSSIDIIFDAGTGRNIFNRDILKKIREIEDEVTHAKDYDKMCQLDPSTNDCLPPGSVTQFFDGTFASINPIFNDTNFENINAVANEAKTNNLTKEKFAYFLDKDNTHSNNVVKTSITRTTIYFGQPHETYEDTQDTRVDEYCGEVMKPILEKHMEENGLFTMVFRSVPLWQYDVRNQAFKDMYLAGASMAFIFFLILFHTRSLWIAGFAMMSIFGSFVTGNLIYNLIYSYKYLGFFHVLAVFIILGIGADNIFVFYDMWRASATEQYLSLAHRLSDVYKRSAISMFFTSLTTTVAFLSTAILPLLGIRSFGLFAGTVVAVNYISVITQFPIVILMYHKYFEHTKWPCCVPCVHLKKKCCQKESEHYEEDGIRENRLKNTEGDEDVSKNVDRGKFNPVFISNDYQSYPGQSRFPNENRPRSISPYIVEPGPDYSFPRINGGSPEYSNGGIRSDRYNDNRQPIHIQYTRNNQEGNLPRNGGPYDYEVTPFPHKGYEKRSHDDTFFYDGKKETGRLQGSPARHYKIDAPNDRYQNGGMDSGKHWNPVKQAVQSSSKELQGRKKKSISVQFFTNYYFRFVTHRVIRWVIPLVLFGVLAFFIYEASTLKAAGEIFKVLPDDHHFVKAAVYKKESFVSNSKAEIVSVNLMFGSLENDLSVCDFTTPICRGNQGHDPRFNPSTMEAQLVIKNLCTTLKTLPEKDAEDLAILKNQFTGQYEVKCFMDNFEVFLENEASTTGENLTLPITNAKMVAFMNTRPKFYNLTAFDVNTFNDTLQVPLSYWLFNRYDGSFSDDFKTYDSMIGEEKVNNAYYGNNIMHMTIQVDTSLRFGTLNPSEGIPRMIMNAMYGIIIGVCLAFPILVIATGNIITGLLATFCMCCCTACVVGVIPLGGWNLGLVESINMCMIVGLAVDYVVHLAEGYTHSMHRDRLSRVRDMLEEMAVPVFFGAITTLGAAAFMFLTKLTFFMQFGVFLFSTIGFSLVYSMGLFVTLMGIVGPENDTGDLYALFRRCCRRRK
ncbi:DISP3-like protein [Mya arenaria]|uniref:DISP3-like protein n=1 Tax=Mya arenaria TaxID=6604 RepID=A0ABY7E1V7_MYAAR|nr:DISP3-like protein [Mya arenaria]